jgi:ferredoxin-NADP reductase
MIQQYKARIIEKKYLTQYVLEIAVVLVVPELVEFLAGQFMQFQIGDELKSYSIVSSPNENTVLTFCVGLVEGGKATEFFKAAKIGKEINLRGPAGNFTMDDFSKNYFFVATGVGVAPYASIITDMLVRGYSNKCRLLFGLRFEEDVFYFDRFTHLQNQYPNFTFTPILSRPVSHWPGETGHVTTYIDVAYEYYKDYIFYISGRQQMVDDVKALLLKRGHDPKNLKVEIFI